MSKDDTAQPEMLARQFLDLWQRQLAMMGRDPDVLQGMMQMFNGMQHYLTDSMAPFTQNSFTPQAFTHPFAQAASHAAKQAPGRTAPHAGLHEPYGTGGAIGDAELLELHSRLRACEERLDSLERASRTAGPRSGKPAAAKRRTGSGKGRAKGSRKPAR